MPDHLEDMHIVAVWRGTASWENLILCRCGCVWYETLSLEGVPIRLRLNSWPNDIEDVAQWAADDGWVRLEQIEEPVDA